MLGSHNSWTYLKPRKWWMRLLGFIAKCQDYDIYAQYSSGVRCFDLRIRYNSEGAITVAHGLIEYDITFNELMEHLKFLNKGNDCYVRILHEVRWKWQYKEEDCYAFSDLCYDLQDVFKKIRFIGGYNLYTGSQDYVPLYNTLKGTIVNSQWFIPRWYARRHNNSLAVENLEEMMGKSKLLMLDFINYVRKS